MFVAAAPTLAGTETYIGAPGGEWNATGNWNPSGIPASGDTAIFAPAGSGTYNDNGSYLLPSKLGELILGDGSGSTPTLIQSSTTINVTTDFLESGTFDQSGGTHNSGSLDVGSFAGGAATYVYGGGSLTSGTTFVGIGGDGTFIQNGSLKTSLGTLTIGLNANGAGTVSTSGGTLNALNVYVGQNGGLGMVSSSGGTFNAITAYVGQNSGTGTYFQSGSLSSGSFAVALDLGVGSNAVGIASLSGGTLTAFDVNVGGDGTVGGTGTFVQTGSFSISNVGQLNVGSGTATSGTVSLSGGSLTATDTNVGTLGTGTFLQSGSQTTSSMGTLTVGYGAGAAGTVSVSAGTLLCSVINVGLSGGAGTLLQNGGTVGNLLNIGDGTGSTGLFSQSGGTFTARSAIEVGTAGGTGTYEQDGSLSASNLGTINVGDGNSSTGIASLSDGSFSAFIAFFGFNGGIGTFLQAGGSSNFASLALGVSTASQGTLVLSAGSLTANGANVGSFGGVGTFLQNGSMTVSTFRSLLLGNNVGSNGTLSQSAGSLTTTTNFEVGFSGGAGTFVESGSLTTCSAAGLYAGDGTAAEGTISLTGGVLTGTTIDIGDGGLGTYLQNGPSSCEFTYFWVGGPYAGTGTAILSVGSIVTSNVTDIGLAGGSGTFLENGSLAVSNLGNLFIGDGTTSVGAVLMSAGSMTATETNVGINGLGTFSQSGSFSSLGTLNIGPNGTLALSAGTVNAKTIMSSGVVNISGGTLAITGAGSLGSSSISSTGLSITGPGVLDIGSSGMVIEYGTNPSPVGDLSFAQTARNYPANSIQRYAQTAINGLNWNGPGISSSFAENDPNGLTAVGIADENDLLNVYPSNYSVAGGGTGTWMGQPINDTDNVLVRMTYYGDGNLDGVVNRLDVTALSQGYSGLAGYVGWSDGDYTYSGDITKVDVGLLAQSYLFQGAPLGDAITSGQAQYLLALDPDMPANVQADFQSIAGTPEPATLSLMAASLGLLARRRRARTIAPWCGLSPTP